MPSSLDVTSPEFLEDPYRFYAARRAQGAILRTGEHTWGLFGYDCIAQVLSNPRAGRGNIGQLPSPGGDVSARNKIIADNPALEILDDWMLFKNPPEHPRMRKLVLKAFTPTRVAGMEQRMRETAGAMLDRILEDRSVRGFDLVEDLAFPFPASVICEMIGIPNEHRDRFRAWTGDLAQAVSIDFLRIDDATRARMNRSAFELKHYFEEFLNTENRVGEDDLISRLQSAQEDGERLSQSEVLANCVFLLFSGHETTTSLIANGVHALLRNPDQYRALAEDPALIPNAVEECLRYDPPIQMVGRFALGDIPIGARVIRAGHHMYAFLGAAGRDPAVNPDPDRFDVRRQPVHHLAFARGAHHCLGSSLARLEARIVLEELVRRFPDLRLCGKPVRRDTWLMRNFDRLPVQY